MALQQIRSIFHRFFDRTPRRFSSLYHRIDWNQLESVLRYRIRNKDHFVQALIHRSFIPVARIEDLESNERMEFLGDAVLSIVVAEYLYGKHPLKGEGDLTILRSRLVNRKALAYFAREIDLRRFLLSHTNSVGVIEKGFDTILSDAYEAVIAAIYLDSGIEEARNFILRGLISGVEKGMLKTGDQNFKSELLELSQAKGKGIPKYHTVKEEGPDHDRTFTVQVAVGDEVMGEGIGKNKKEAEQSAAEIAVQKLQSGS